MCFYDKRATIKATFPVVSFVRFKNYNLVVLFIMNKHVCSYLLSYHTSLSFSSFPLLPFFSSSFLRPGLLFRTPLKGWSRL
uniref:Uncharacterized protein n=1 Tax=Octopus bimaculoides TaxID=37653 RepID=A0A0L8HQE1_OCTBM